MSCRPPEISAFILAGGASRRMKRDKALVPYAGETLLARAIRIVEPITDSIFIVGKPEQHALYSHPVLADCAESQGPLTGILTALEATSSPVNLILACDMPWMRTDFFRVLLKSVPPADAAAMRFDDGAIEPLCAVYSSRCAGFIAPRLKLGQRGVIDFLDKIKVAYLTEMALSQNHLDKQIFANINTPEDLIRIESEPGALIRPLITE